jgi:D-alanyl-D-alanine carboxypeptidase
MIGLFKNFHKESKVIKDKDRASQEFMAKFAGKCNQMYYFLRSNNLTLKKTSKKIIHISFLLFAVSFSFTSIIAQENDVVINTQYSKAAAIQSIMKQYIDEGLPGAVIAVYSEQEGWWAHAEGYAKTEDKTPMEISHLQYLQSVSKTYMAAAILKLYEKGKIDLDAPITKYLPARYILYIKNADVITVRMLLNHTSGIPEYISDAEYVSLVIQHPLTVHKIEDCLKYLTDEDPQFAPGSQYQYTNTNYLLLAMIADAITGDHASFMAENILKPLGLKNTYYRNDPGYLHYENLVDSYWDVLNTGRPANVSLMQQANVASLKGDDGIVCTPIDVVLFFKELMEGRLLKESSLKLMQSWVTNKAGNPVYGMGLSYFAQGGIVGSGHGGGGIGAGCLLLYVPSKKIYVFISTNIGVLIEGKLPLKADSMKNEILAVVLQ